MMRIYVVPFDDFSTGENVERVEVDSERPSVVIAHEDLYAISRL